MPRSGARSPSTHSIVVVLPAPFGPIRPKISPGCDVEGDVIDGDRTTVGLAYPGNMDRRAETCPAEHSVTRQSHLDADPGKVYSSASSHRRIRQTGVLRSGGHANRGSMTEPALVPVSLRVQVERILATGRFLRCATVLLSLAAPASVAAQTPIACGETLAASIGVAAETLIGESELLEQADRRRRRCDRATPRSRRLPTP